VEREAYARATLLAGLVTPWTHTLEQPVPERLHPVEGTHAGAVREALQPVGRTSAGEVCAELSLVRGIFTLEQGQSVRNPPLEEEGAAETMCDELTIIPVPQPLVPLGGRRERNRSEVAPRKKGGVGREGDLGFSVISYYATLI